MAKENSSSVRRRLTRHLVDLCMALVASIVVLIVISGAVPWMPLQDQTVWRFRVLRTLLAALAGMIVLQLGEPCIDCIIATGRFRPAGGTAVRSPQIATATAWTLTP